MLNLGNECECGTMCIYADRRPVSQQAHPCVEGHHDYGKDLHNSLRLFWVKSSKHRKHCKQRVWAKCCTQSRHTSKIAQTEGATWASCSMNIGPRFGLPDLKSLPAPPTEPRCSGALPMNIILLPANFPKSLAASSAKSCVIAPLLSQPS